MKLVKNLIDKKHLSSYYNNLDHMINDFKQMVESTSDLTEGIDYEFVEVDESKLSETHTCPNCGAENVQKYVDILSVAANESNKACDNCIDDSEDEWDLLSR